MKKRPARRNQRTGELEPPWSGYRKQQELMAQRMSAAEIAEARRMAQLLTTTGLPADWLAGPQKSDLGPLFDVHND